MEERSYKWFLQELSNSNLSLKILEAGICRGTKVVSWFSNLKNDNISTKPVKEMKNTKSLINYFLNARIPMIEEYTPQKLICFLYHKTGKKLVTAKEAIELAENQLHGLHVTSAHLAMTCQSHIFTVKASNSKGEFSTEITMSKFGQPESQSVKDKAQIDEIVDYFVYVNELLMKIHNKEIHDIVLDLTKDSNGSMTLIKITELRFKFNNIQNVFIRASSIKLITQESSEEESLTDEEPPSLARQTLSSYLFKERSPVKALSRKTQNNSQEFLEMIAKTIDKDRKKNYEKTENLQESEFKHQVFARKSFRDSKSIKKTMSNLNDLLFYLEKTRPRVWVKDKGEICYSTRNSSLTNKRGNLDSGINTMRNSTKDSVKILKNAKLDSIIKDRSNGLFVRRRTSERILRKSV